MTSVVAALIRHGMYHQPPGVPSAHLPHPLTRNGRAQAAGLATVLIEAAAQRGWRLHRTIDSSELLRAWETAGVLSRRLAQGLDREFRVQGFAALAERGLGSAANLTVARIEAIAAADPRLGPLPRNWKAESQFRLPFPGAESLIEAGQRAARHLEARMRALARRARRDVVKLFVGHGGAFRHAAVALGVLPLEAASGLSMHHCRPVFLERLGEGHWRQVGGEWKPRRTGAPDDL